MDDQDASSIHSVSQQKKIVRVLFFWKGNNISKSKEVCTIMISMGENKYLNINTACSVRLRK